MPKTTPAAGDLALQRMVAQPANRAKALAQQQSGAIAGIVPTGTESTGFATPASATDRVAADYGILQPYGSGTGTGQWMTSGVGYETLDNSGNPMMRSGNLLVTKAGATYFQDGGWVLLDADGNVVAGYTESLGVFGFGGGGGGGGGGLLNPSLFTGFSVNDIAQNSEQQWMVEFDAGDAFVDQIGVTFSDGNIVLPSGLFEITAFFGVADFEFVNANTNAVLMYGTITSLVTPLQQINFVTNGSTSYPPVVPVAGSATTTVTPQTVGYSTAAITFGGTNVEGTTLTTIQNSFIGGICALDTVVGGIQGNLSASGTATMELLIGQIM